MIEIKDIQGNIIYSVPVTQQSQRVEELMTSDYIQLYWNSDRNDTIEAGSYIEYKGEKFALLEPYSPRQKSEVEFEYSPQFKSKIMGWGKLPFFFYTTNGDKTAKEPDWTLTGTPSNFMKCVCDALLNETGEEWSYTIDASLPASASLSFSSVDILSGLNDIANAFETEWHVDKSTNTIHLEKASIGEEVTLEVGSNIKVPSVNNTKEGYYTRFYAFGSTRNITQSYEGANVNNLVNKRLTLDPQKYPNGYKDIREGLSKGEIFSKVLIFDDVYPKAKLSISNVRNRLMYRVDESGNKIQIGTDEKGNPIYDQYAIWYFKIEGFEYDKENEIEGLKPHVSFQSGALNGREFEVKYYDKFQNISSSDGSFNVYAGEYEIFFVEENNYIIPSMTGLVPSDGDKVVLFNIKMPSEYTQSAYEELEAELDKEIERSKSDLNNYTFDSNPVSFNESNPNLYLGRKVKYVNGDYSYSTRIIKLTTKLDFPIEQNITIGNEKIKGNTQQLKEEVVSANKDLNLLATINEMTQSLQQSYTRTQQMMLEGFAAIKNIWQLKTDSNGNTYAFSAFDIVTQKGITMYANGGLLDLPSIYAGLPIDGITLYWENGVLKAQGGSGEGSGISEEQLESYLTVNQYAKKSDIPSLNGYATESWVTGRGYINTTTLSSELSKYVPISGDTDILGLKNFTKGLLIDGLSITKSQDDVIYLDANLVVRGGITMFGTNSVDVPTIMDSIATDNVNLKVVDGVLTFVGQTGGGAADSVLWDNIDGKPSWIGSSKPSYSYSEISGTPTLLSSFTNDLGFVDSSALSDYLPLNGGTISNTYDALIVKRLSDIGSAYIKYDNNEGLLGTIGIGGSGATFPYEPYFQNKNGTAYKIYHSGNDGADSGLDADLLDGKHATAFALSNNDIKLDSFINQIGYGFKSQGWYDSGAAMMFGANSSYYMLLQGASNGSKIALRANYVYNGSYVGWKEIAFTDSNVASATKLETPRTIWGQSFDGSGNVSGDLAVGDGDIYIANNKKIRANPTSGSSIELLRLNNQNAFVIGDGVASSGFGTYLNGYDVVLRYGTSHTEGMRLTSTGNVLIGTTTDSGYKLDVSGDMYVKSTATLAGGIVLPGNSAENSCIRFSRENGNYIYLPRLLIIGSNNDDRWYYIYKQHIYPYVNNAQTLGTSSNRWSNIYSVLGNFSGDVTFGSKAIINGIPIYKSQDGVLYIDGNLAVKGGITMYATDAIDVPSIIDALPIASTSVKGIASFNPSDFAVNDGVVSYVGKGGVDESVLADYAKKVDLNAYLPLSGGKVTGQIEYNLDRDTSIGLVSVPAAGTFYYNVSMESEGSLNQKKSFIGTARNNSYDSWWNLISIRHVNGSSSDSNKYGMYISSSMTDAGSITWNKQIGTGWIGERVILDSVNWSQYVKAGDGGSYLPLSGGTMTSGVRLDSAANIYLQSTSGNNWNIFDVNGKRAFCVESGGYVGVGRVYDSGKTYRLAVEGNSYIGGYEVLQVAASGAGSYNRICLSTYYTPNDENWQSELISDYYGNNVCKTGGFTHGVFFKGGRSGFDNFIFLDSSGNPVVRLSASNTGMGHHFMGDILTSGGITMYSDIRKKTILNNVELTLQQIADAPLIEHFYNSDEKRTTHVGSIAQYWASMNDWFCKLDGEGYYTMEIQNAALASAISVARELMRYETKTDRKIRLLKKRIVELEDKIEEFKKKGA